MNFLSWPGLSRPSTPLGCDDPKTWMPGTRPGMTKMRLVPFLFAILVSVNLSGPANAADVAFQQWLAQQRPAAQALGVSRATFDSATQGLELDLTLPDLAIPGKPEKQPQQPEFVQTPSQYLRESSFDRLATRGRELAA